MCGTQPMRSERGVGAGGSYAERGVRGVGVVRDVAGRLHGAHPRQRPVSGAGRHVLGLPSTRSVAPIGSDELQATASFSYLSTKTPSLPDYSSWVAWLRASIASWRARALVACCVHALTCRTGTSSATWPATLSASPGSLPPRCAPRRTRSLQLCLARGWLTRSGVGVSVGTLLPFA